MERAPDRGHHSANIHRQLFLRSPFDPPARQSKALSRHELKGAEGVLMPPTIANGKICYIEMPADDVARSAEFYKRVFGWEIRRRNDGSTAFNDTTGEVSGSWILGRSPASEPGILFYVMVDSVPATMSAIVDSGGEIVQPVGVDAPEITARFRDPAGNVIGLYHQRA
jgi:predicted enzyme related to lactoylglutathione lyase